MASKEMHELLEPENLARQIEDHENVSARGRKLSVVSHVSRKFSKSPAIKRAMQGTRVER